MKKKPKWAPDGSDWRSDKAKMLIRTFPDVLGKMFFPKKSWLPEALDHVLDTTDDRLTHPRRPRTSLEKKLKIEIFDELFDVDDRLRLSSKIIDYASTTVFFNSN